MSFAKKLKRQKEANTRKIVDKVTSRIKEAKKLGRSITKARQRDMFDFYQAKILTAVSYIMATQFEWGFAKLVKAAARFKYLMDDLIVGGPKEGHVYLTIPWLAEGLELECKYKVAKVEKLPGPDDLASVEAWVEYYKENFGVVLFGYIETVWLWVLHEIFGFGKKRLERFHELLSEFDPVHAPMKMIYHAMDWLEGLRTYRKGADGKCKKLSLDTFRERFERLDVDKNGFANGLNLMAA